MFLAIFPENYFLLLEIGKFLVLPALFGGWQAIQWIVGLKANRKEKAAEQLERLFALLTEDVQRKNVRIKQLEKEYEDLDADHDELKIDVRKARGEMLEIKPLLSKVKNGELEEKENLKIFDEIEDRLATATEKLDINQHKN